MKAIGRFLIYFILTTVLLALLLSWRSDGVFELKSIIITVLKIHGFIFIPVFIVVKGLQPFKQTWSLKYHTFFIFFLIYGLIATNPVLMATVLLTKPETLAELHSFLPIVLLLILIYSWQQAKNDLEQRHKKEKV